MKPHRRTCFARPHLTFVLFLLAAIIWGLAAGCTAASNNLAEDDGRCAEGEIFDPELDAAGRGGGQGGVESSTVGCRSVNSPADESADAYRSENGKCDLEDLGDSYAENQKRIEAWEACKKPRPPSPPFLMPVKGTEIAEASGQQAVRTVKQNHEASGLSRSYWLELGLTLQNMAETDTGNIVFDCFTAILPAQIDNDLMTEEWKEWEHLDGTIYKSASSERGETWNSQFAKHFMRLCLKAASAEAKSWDKTTADFLASCSDQYSRIVSMEDVLLNKPWQLDDHCDV